MRTGLVFGTFDGVHKGHVHFLEQALEHCDRLIASVPSDALVAHFKGKSPKHSFSERVAFLLETGLVDKVVSSDEEPGNYQVISTAHPDMVLLGYDQLDLKSDLERYLKSTNQSIQIELLSPYKQDLYKSSLINL